MKQKIFGIGLSKTGTTTLYAALNILGFRTGTFKHMRVLGMRQWFLGNFRHDYLKDYEAMTDLPIGCFFRELDKRYPGSKFILTTREFDDWMNSCSVFFSRPAINDFAAKVNHLMYGTVAYNVDSFAKTYWDHHKSVADYFSGRQNQLLQLDIFAGNGWINLCEFLEKEIPNEEFPKVKPGYLYPSDPIKSKIQKFKRRKIRLHRIKSLFSALQHYFLKRE